MTNNKMIAELEQRIAEHEACRDSGKCKHAAPYHGVKINSYRTRIQVIRGRMTKEKVNVPGA